MRVLAVLPDGMLNLSVHEMMEATRDTGTERFGSSFEMDISLSPFWSVKNPDYHIIHIHWPEALFDWKRINKSDIQLMTERLDELRQQGKKIVITRHNSIPHRRDHWDKELYEKAYEKADAIFHMEDFSLQEYKEMYGQYEWTSNQQHFFAPIIMYTKLMNTVSPEDARKMLNIPSDHFVFMVLGSIRNQEEKKLLEKVARSLSNKDMLYVAQWPLYGSKPIVKTVRRYFQKIRFPKHIFKAAETIPDEQMQVYLNAADVLIIPRIHSLNSGLISLAFSFKKTVLGPSSGNMGPILAKSGNAIFDINNLSNLVEHLEYAKKLAHQDQGIHNFNYATEYWSWEKVGQLHIDAYTKLLSN